MSINELRKMSENERMEWIVNAESYDIDFVLKNSGIKGISKIKKVEKLAMLVKLVEENITDKEIDAMVVKLLENITDKEIDAIMEDTKRLNEELSVRRSFGDNIECTLYARYKNKEINFNELKKVCDKYHLNIPLNDDEKSSIEFIDKSYDMYSTYMHYDEDGNIYYALFDERYQWDNMCRKDNMCEDEDWDIQEFYKINTVDYDGDLQLAFTYDNELHYVLCVYKYYDLLATYVEGTTHKIKELVAYDYRLVDKDLDTYEELLELLDQQCKEYWMILKADEMLQNKLKIAKEYSRQLTIDALNRSNA